MIIIGLIFLAIVIGLIVYLILGSWVSFLIAFLCSLITICVVYGVIKIIPWIKDVLNHLWNK